MTTPDSCNIVALLIYAAPEGVLVHGISVCLLLNESLYRRYQYITQF